MWPVSIDTGDSERPASHLGPTDSKDDINLVLLPPLTPVTVHLHVAYPDGSPVIAAQIIATDRLSPVSAMGARADANGDADIALYVGRDYTLVATTGSSREPACAGPVHFTAAQTLKLGTLTLDKTLSACRTLQFSK